MKISKVLPRFMVNHIVNLRDAVKVSLEPTYYPEKKRKKKIRRLCDNILWVWRHHEANLFYNLYAFDLKNCKNKGNYIDYRSFKISRDRINLVKQEVSWTVFLRDKYWFYQALHTANINTPSVFAVLDHGLLFNMQNQQCGEELVMDEKNFFVKDRTGECASFVKKMADYQCFSDIRDTLKDDYILQKCIYQHEDMNKLNPGAINTLRMVTVLTDGTPEVLTTLLRVGTKQTGNVDNWAAGGLAIGINDDGSLKKYGFYKPHFGGKVDRHPDTGIVFESFVVPYFEEAKELAKRAHTLFPRIGAIGWDIVITPDGPAFIEGNDNWEISLMQACDRPLKAEWFSAVKSNLSYDSKN